MGVGTSTLLGICDVDSLNFGWNKYTMDTIALFTQKLGIILHNTRIELRPDEARDGSL